MLRLAVSLTLAALVLGGGATTAQQDSEYKVKAAFVSSVLKFVQWPESEPMANQGQVTVAVLGPAAGEVVATSLRGTTLKGLPISVRSYNRASELQTCDVLFVAAEAESELAAALRAVEGRPVLTITEVGAKTASTSVINLIVVETKLAFQVNLDASERNRLRLGANLLNLAKRVTGGTAARGLP